MNSACITADLTYAPQVPRPSSVTLFCGAARVPTWYATTVTPPAHLPTCLPTCLPACLRACLHLLPPPNASSARLLFCTLSIAIIFKYSSRVCSSHSPRPLKSFLLSAQAFPTHPGFSPGHLLPLSSSLPIPLARHIQKIFTFLHTPSVLCPLQPPLGPDALTHFPHRSHFPHPSSSSVFIPFQSN